MDGREMKNANLFKNGYRWLNSVLDKYTHPNSFAAFAVEKLQRNCFSFCEMWLFKMEISSAHYTFRSKLPIIDNQDISMKLISLIRSTDEFIFTW